MQNQTRRTRLCARAATYAAAAFVVILLLPSTLNAQTIREREAKRQEMRMKEWAIRNLDRMKNAPPEKETDMLPAYEAAGKDFEQLQVINYSLASFTQQASALDYVLIKKQSGEVKKLASRLKIFLALPKVGDEQSKGRYAEVVTPEGLRTAVSSLDALVSSFAQNPIFSDLGVVDLEQSSRAARDLAGIIYMSERINRCAAEMSKIAKREGKK